MFAREGRTSGNQVGGCSFEDDPAAFVTSTRAEVDKPVGVRHHGLMMFDDDD